MATSTEYLTQVSNLYVALFNRAPDTEGMKFWSEGLANGASLKTVINGFLTAPEGTALYTPTQTATQFIDTFYQTVFQRSPDPGGLEFWLAALQSAGGVKSADARVYVVNGIIGTVSSQLASKPFGLSDADYERTLNDRALFGNKVAYATFVGTYQGSAVNPGAQTSLTAITADPGSVSAAKLAFNQPANPGEGGGGGTGPDPIDATPIVGTDNDDVLTVANAASFSKTGFSVDGLGGIDTLIVQQATGAIDATDSIAGIEILQITTSGATTIDATQFAGVGSFGSLNAAAALAVSNLEEGQAITVAGANVDTSFGFGDAATTAALVLTDAQGGAVRVTGTALASLEVTAGGEEGGLGNNLALLDVTGSAITAIGIDATRELSVGDITGGTDATLTIGGSAKVIISAVSGVAAVDASTNTAGIALYDLVNATSFIGTDSADALGLSGLLGAGATIDLGAGNDMLAFSAGTLFDASGVTVTTGDGADTIDVSALALVDESEVGMAQKMVTITDFGAGDTIVFSAATPTAGSAILNYDQTGAEALYLAAGAAIEASAAEATPVGIVGFRYAGDTFIVADAANDGAYGEGDILVKLTGLANLSTVSVVGNAVTFAEIPELV